MTAKDFRRLALALPETEERSHMEHPDFRVCGKIFATLGYPDKSHGMVKLPPEQQHYFSKGLFRSVPTRQGSLGTSRRYQREPQGRKKEVLRKAIHAAWHNTSPQRLRKQLAKDLTKS